MKNNDKLKPFGDRNYDYYRLTMNLGCNNSPYGSKKYILPQGSIFVHDKDNKADGSVGDGCLTLCWTKEGNTQGWICGECQHFHASFMYTDLFEKVEDDTKENELENIILKLEDQLKEVKDKLNKLHR